MTKPFHKFHQGPIVTMRWSTKHDLWSRVDIGVGAREQTANCLAQLKVGKRILLLYTAKLAPTWAQELAELLRADKYVVSELALPDGEECKSLETLSLVWDALQTN